MVFPLAGAVLGTNGAGALSGLAGGLGKIIPGLGGLFGGAADLAETRGLRNDIKGMANQDPLNFSGPGATVNSQTGNVQLDQLQTLLQGVFGGQSANLGMGGMFNSNNLGGAIGGMDFSDALGQANNAFSQQANPFYNQGSFNQGMSNVGNLGNMFASNTMGGPRDFSGGAQGQLIGSGMQNMIRAGDQSSLYNQQLSTLRNAAQPATDRMFNKLNDRLFATGQLGSTGGSQQMEGFFNALNQQDAGFQNQAFGQANQQQQFLSGLGGQQMGLGQGFLGQNLGQFNQNAQNAMGFAGLGGQLEGQGFNQGLQSLMANQSAGANRLASMQGLMGFGGDLFGQQFGLGLQGGQFTQEQNMFGRDTLINLLNANANRIGATGHHANALANTQGSSGGLGGLIGGITKGIGGLFG